MEPVEIAVAGRAAAVVQFVKLAIEAKQGAQHGRIKEIHERVEFVNAVLDGCAGKHESVTAAQAFDGLGGLGAPVLDALGFIQHDDVGLEPRVDLQRIGQHLLVVDNSEERRRVRRSRSNEAVLDFGFRISDFGFGG